MEGRHQRRGCHGSDWPLPQSTSPLIRPRQNARRKAQAVKRSNTDVALGWPLRYSHSPAEVVDVRDVEALGKIIAEIAREW